MATSNRANWHELKRMYPDEWVALVDYHQKDAIEIEGVVVVHDHDRRNFHKAISKILPKHGDIAIRYTGDLIKNETLPLLWQISHTE